MTSMAAPSRNKLVLSLYFVAAGLAFSAALVRYFKDGEINSVAIAAGVIMVAFGFFIAARGGRPDG